MPFNNTDHSEMFMVWGTTIVMKKESFALKRKHSVRYIKFTLAHRFFLKKNAEVLTWKN